MKKAIYTLSVIAVIGLIVLILVFNKRATAEKTDLVAELSTAVAVKTEVVADAAYMLEFQINGVLEARNDLSFVSDMAGRVVQVYADEGDKVARGKILIQLDNETLSADAASSEAAYNALKKDYERFKNANIQGGVTDQQLDNIRTQMIAAESRMIASKRRLADSSIKSPISGTIYKRYVEVGSYLNPGAKLFDIIDDSQLKVMGYVTEKQRLLIEKGYPVAVKSEMFPGETFAGVVSFVSNKADRTFNFPIEITLVDPGKGLMPGMYVTVAVSQKEEKKGVLIPRNAISSSMQDASVYIVRGGVARKQAITIGNMVGERIEVLQGLNPGDSIIVAGLINVSEGTQVKHIN